MGGRARYGWESRGVWNAKGGGRPGSQLDDAESSSVHAPSRGESEVEGTSRRSSDIGARRGGIHHPSAKFPVLPYLPYVENRMLHCPLAGCNA